MRKGVGRHSMELYENLAHFISICMKKGVGRHSREFVFTFYSFCIHGLSSYFNIKSKF